MAITKVQINYLSNKLCNVVDEKSNSFKQELLNKHSFVSNQFYQELRHQISLGNVKLKSKAEITKEIKETCDRCANYTYYNTTNIDIAELFNKEQVDALKAILDGINKQNEEYRIKLLKAKDGIMDRIVLEGLDIETALAELNDIK